MKGITAAIPSDVFAGSATRTGAVLPFVLRQISRKPVLACADQAIVSGTSFLSLVLVARATDIAQVGAYALGISILGIALAIQHALISMPYAIQRHRPADEAGEHAFSGLVLTALGAAGWALLLAGAAIVLTWSGKGTVAADSAWLLATAIPFVLIREFAREFDIARVNFGRALALDTASGVLQLLLIACLGAFGVLSANTAYVAIAVSSGIAVAGWMLVAHRAFTLRFGRVMENAAQSWEVGKWLFLSRAAGLIQGYSTYWISMAAAGPAVTGAYAACMSVVGLANPLMLGFYNLLVPRSVLTWKEGGGAALYRQSLLDTLLLGALMGCFFVAVLVAGEPIMGILYPDEMAVGYGPTLAVLALGLLISAIGIPAANGLASMERPRATATIGGAAAVFNVVLVWALMSHWGLIGAAVAILIANLFSTSGKWIAFSRLLPGARP